MKAEAPIFFIGMPRSGTTVVFEIFARHRSLAWLSNYSTHFPGSPWITALHRLAFGRVGEKRQGQKVPAFNAWLPKPAENYNVWESFFGREFLFDSLAESSADPDSAARMRKYVDHLIIAQGRSRLCAKLTGPPRIRFIDSVFQNPVFIDVIRDPRAVVASLLNKEFWMSSGGHSKPFWSGTISETIRKEAEARMSSSRVAWTALQWSAVLELTDRERQILGGRFMRLRYEDFVEMPQETVERVTRFLQLEDSEEVMRYAETRNLSDMNHKAFNRLSSKELSEIEEMLEPQMKAHGYIR